MSKSVIACVEDLFFRSKIEATARHLNVPVRFVAAGELAKACADKNAAAVLLELSSNGDALAVRAGAAQRTGRRGDARHRLSLPRRQGRSPGEAEAAGVSQVMPRSQFSETLPDLLMDLVAPGTKREVQEEPELPDE